MNRSTLSDLLIIGRRCRFRHAHPGATRGLCSLLGDLPPPPFERKTSLFSDSTLPLLVHPLIPLRYFQMSHSSLKIDITRRSTREKVMFKQQGKVGAIRRNVRGRACVSCGSRNYQLVLRSLKQPQLGKLFARCSQCHQCREIDEDLGRILWM